MKRKGIIKEKIPGYPVAAVLFILFMSMVLVSTFINDPIRSLTGIALILSGVPFYYFFKKGKFKNDATVNMTVDAATNTEERIK